MKCHISCYLQFLVCLVSRGLAETRTYDFTLSESYIAQDGTYKAIKTINGISPGPTIEADENDWISVKVINNLQVPASIHFHGVLQQGTPWLDGVPGLTQYPIASGAFFMYHFQVKNQYGAFWYHLHYRGYLSDGLYGLIYVRPGLHRQRPYNLVTQDASDLQLIHRLEKSPANLAADDSFQVDTDALFLRMFQHGIDPLCIQSILVNGKGRVLCHRPREFRRLASKNPFLMHLPEFDSMGCVKDPSLQVFNGVPIDHKGLQAPGFSSPCQATTSLLHVHYTEGLKWQYINVLNAGGQNTKAFSIDDHPFFLVAVDGVFVIPKQHHSLLIPVGSRCTILVQTDPLQHDDVSRPFLIRFAASHTPQYIEGLALLIYGFTNEPLDRLELEISTFSNGQKFQDLDGQLLSRSDKSGWTHETVPFEKESLLTAFGPADVTFNFFLRMFDLVQFTMFSSRGQLPPDFESSKPLMEIWHESQMDGLRSTENKAIIYPPVKIGQTVDLIVNNNKHINHPVHLHGHYVHLLSYSVHENFAFPTLTDAIAANCSTLNVKNPPLLDVVLIPVGGHAVLRFVADNPGIWLLHCHNIGHLMGGMGAILLEGLESLPPMTTPVAQF